MVLFTWDDSYSVNIQEIDNQHKKLIELLSGLHAAMSVGKGQQVLEETLQGLIDYTKTHFKYEENLMRLYHYPAFENHKKEHDDLTQKVLDFQKEFQTQRIGMTLDLLMFLKNWLIQHIQGTDKQYSPFLKGKGVG